MSGLVLISNQLVWIASRCVDPRRREGTVGEGLRSEGVLKSKLSDSATSSIIFISDLCFGKFGSKHNQKQFFAEQCSRQNFCLCKANSSNVWIMDLNSPKKWLRMNNNVAPYMLDVLKRFFLLTEFLKNANVVCFTAPNCFNLLMPNCSMHHT